MCLALTEINFSSVPAQSPTPTPNPQDDANEDGAYLADLFTYLYDKYSGYAYGSNLIDTPLRVLWFSATDDIKVPPGMPRRYLGLFDSHGYQKLAQSLYCPYYGGLPYLDALYAWLTTQGCHP
jgi:hypothetical protein